MNKSVAIVIGNTGNTKVEIAIKDSFSVKRGEFIRIQHQESPEEPQQWILGKVLKVSRESFIYQKGLGSGLIDSPNFLPPNLDEEVFGVVELIGFKDTSSGEVRMPRRPLDPGMNVFRVDKFFLKQFYDYDPEASLPIGRLVGYEKGDNKLEIYLDINRLVSQHVAVLAMTGSGKSFTIGRITEWIVAKGNGSVVVIDPHGEYGECFRNGQLAPYTNDGLDEDYKREIVGTYSQINERLKLGGGVKVFAPKSREADLKYGVGNYNELSLCLDDLQIDELSALFSDLSEPQYRVLSFIFKYWLETERKPRDPNRLLDFLGSEFESIKNKSSNESEAVALNKRSASIIAARLRNLLEGVNVFYSMGKKPTDVVNIVGHSAGLNMSDKVGRLAIIDLQSMPAEFMQICAAIVCNNLLKASMSRNHGIRKSFLVVEEAHNFIPSQFNPISKRIINRIASEGRKFGLGLCVVSQRPGKIDSDITSQCNTQIIMRIRNPEDQKYIEKTSEYVSEYDLSEIPALSAGEALILGKAIMTPLLVKIGPRALRHGGETPRIWQSWRINDPLLEHRNDC
jgi:hypothetical protein